MSSPGALPGGGGVCGVGVDAVDVDRFRRVIERRPALLDRLFTDAERDYAGRTPDPGPRLAVRFAAKEAVLKALGVGIGAAPFRDVEVERDDEGRPTLRLWGAAASLAARRGVQRWHVSLSHTDALAVASVVAEGAPVDGTVHGDGGGAVDTSGVDTGGVDTGGVDTSGVDAAGTAR